MSTAYATWWHDLTEGVGVATALDATRVRRFESGGRVLEVLDHERFGRLIALDGALVHVDEDAAWREMLVHVPVLGLAAAPRSVLVVGGDPAVIAEVLRHAEIERVSVLAEDAALLQAWAEALGLEAALRDPRLSAVPAVAGELDLVLVARARLATAAVIAGALARGGVVVDSDAVVLTRRGARWYSEPAGDEAGFRPALARETRLAPSGRWFATTPTAAGGFWGFRAWSAVPVELARPRRALDGRHYNRDLHEAAFALPSFWSQLP